jgi:hypothetical protein
MKTKQVTTMENGFLPNIQINQKRRSFLSITRTKPILKYILLNMRTKLVGEITRKNT